MKGIGGFVGYFAIASLMGPALPVWVYWGQKVSLGNWMMTTYEGIFGWVVGLYLLHGLRKYFWMH